MSPRSDSRASALIKALSVGARHAKAAPPPLLPRSVSRHTCVSSSSSIRPHPVMSALSTASSLSRSCSVSRSSCLDVALPCIHRPALPRPARRSRAVLVRAEIPQPKGVVAGLRSSCTKFLQRYDPVTTGIGSLLATGYCVVAHDQSVGEALNIAAAATVLGMVMQEVLFNNDEAKNEA